jgi:hypothetical protein
MNFVQDVWLNSGAWKGHKSSFRVGIPPIEFVKSSCLQQHKMKAIVLPKPRIAAPASGAKIEAVKMDM